MMLGLVIVGCLAGLAAGALSVAWLGLPLWLGIVIWSGLGSLVALVPFLALALRETVAQPGHKRAASRDFAR